MLAACSMSEFQLYEFVALDQSLDAKALEYVRGLSSRAQVSSTHALFTYSYSDFPIDPLKVLAKHYDMMLYVANWGTRRLAFRFPKGVLDLAAVEPYYYGTDEIAIKKLEQYDILDITFDNEGDEEWIYEEGQIESFIALRDELMRGDLRLLYLAWLASVANADGEDEWDEEDDDDDPIEPLVPAGLGELSASLRAFVEFIAIDEDLVGAAARTSPPLKARNEPLEQWLRLLPTSERDAFLLRAAQGEQINNALLRRLQELGGGSTPHISARPRRKLSEILAQAKEVQQQRIQRERAEAKQARLANLAKLAKREKAAWEEVAEHLATRRAQGYDKAVALLDELRQLALHEKRAEAFKARLQSVIQPYVHQRLYWNA